MRHGGTHNNSFCEFSTFLFSFLHMHIFWWNFSVHNFFCTNFFADALSTKPVFQTQCERPSWNSSMKPHKEFFLAFYLLAIVLCYFIAKLFTWDIHTVDYRITIIFRFLQRSWWRWSLRYCMLISITINRSLLMPFVNFLFLLFLPPLLPFELEFIFFIYSHGGQENPQKSHKISSYFLCLGFN